MKHARGTALITAVVLSMTLMGLVAAFFSLVTVEARTQNAHGDAVKSLILAETALNEAILALRTDPEAAAAGTFTLSGKMGGEPWTVSAVEVVDGTWQITAMGRSGDVMRAIRAHLKEETALDPLFGDAALSIVGDITKKGKVKIKVKRSDDGKEDDEDMAIDEDEDWTSSSDSPVAIDGFDEAGQRNVPGLGIQDAQLLAETGQRLAREIAKGKIPEDAIIGDPANSFSTSKKKDEEGSMVDMSLVQLNNPQITNPKLNQIADLIEAKLDNEIIPAADIKVSGKDAKLTGVKTFGTPEDPKITVIDADKVTLQPGAVINGAGTLVIQGDLRILNGAQLNFQGNIFVIGGDKGKDSVLRNQNGTLNVEGNVLVLGGDKAKGKAKFTIHDENSGKNDSFTNIDGAVLALTGNNSDKEEKAEIKIKTGDVTINGLVAAVGDKVKFEVKDHKDKDGKSSSFRLHGSAVVAVPETADDKHKVKVKISGDDILFKFNSVELQEALDGLNALAGIVPDAFPADFHLKAWVEVPAATSGLYLP